MTTHTEIKNNISLKDFQIPIFQSKDEYFPDFLSKKLTDYITYYKSNLYEHVDKKVPFVDNAENVIINKIEKFSNEILKTLEEFYKGKVLEATQTFNQALDDIFFHELPDVLNTIEIGKNFYRGRKNENISLTKPDLFHIKFELRHIVSTNRYSIPGFPALYLGDSTYSCWEEFERHKLRDLWFSRFSNTRELKIIQVQKIENLLSDLEDNIPEVQIVKILSYLVTFPLTIACSIKVKHTNGNFKPEYIIPQLLLQYVSKKEEIDGVKFPSTKIDYSKLTEIEAYNYVFPVKNIHKSGFCDKLVDTFHLTEPTSLELEEIIYNPAKQKMVHGMGTPDGVSQIEFIQGEKSFYSTTSFGKIESSLNRRASSKI